jgi:uncharacterized protein YbjT (DUF2867 family)
LDGPYRALVVGATGAVGSALVAELLASPRCQEVLTLTRRPLAPPGPGEAPVALLRAAPPRA